MRVLYICDPEDADGAGGGSAAEKKMGQEALGQKFVEKRRTGTGSL